METVRINIEFKGGFYIVKGSPHTGIVVSPYDRRDDAPDAIKRAIKTLTEELERITNDHTVQRTN
jgi:hypothetical protein